MTAENSGRLFIGPSRAIDDRRLGNAAFRVLGALASYSDRDGWCWPSHNTIARRLDITRQAVAKQIKVLADLGYIEIESHLRENGSQSTNRYRLLHDTDLAAIHDRLVEAESGLKEEQPDVAGGQLHVAGGATPEVAGGATPEVAPRTSQRTSHLTNTSGATVHELAEGQFETFWQTYPSRRPHSNPKKPAELKFMAALRRGIAAADIIRGAEHFAEHARREGGDPKYVPMAQTWLNQERWADFQAMSVEPEQEAGWL
jgi:biotin operon repressor